MKTRFLIISLVLVCTSCIPVKDSHIDNPLDVGDYKLEIKSFPDTLALLSEHKVPVAFGEDTFQTISVDGNFGKMIYHQKFWNSQDTFFIVIPTACNFLNQIVFDIIATTPFEHKWTYRDSVLITNPFSLSANIDGTNSKIISKVNVSDKFLNMYDSTYFVTWKFNNIIKVLSLFDAFTIDYVADTEFLIEAYVSDKHNNRSCPMNRKFTTMGKPVITKHPKDTSVAAGGRIIFSISVQGKAPKYQWQKNERNISGATDSLYEIKGIDKVDSGKYRCIVFNEAGKDTADNAILRVTELSRPHLNSTSTSTFFDFTLLSYNVAGLLEPFSSSSPSKYTPEISKLTNNYDIVLVQEDFNYHSVLYKNNHHPHRTSTSGGMGFGDGLNIMSKFPYYDFFRQGWKSCNGADCFTPKGFTWMRLRIAEGVYIDLYNVHANAGSGSKNYGARRKNITQLINFAKRNSDGNAMILAGDFNCRYTRSEDNIRSVANELSTTDAWVELVMDNNEPVIGSKALVCRKTDILTDYSCEVVDKIFYRGNRFIKLEALKFTYEDAVFRDGDGNMLSDHHPIYTKFRIKLNNNIRMSDQFGGPHGTSFNDVNKLPDYPVVKSVGIRTGNWVDQVNLTLGTGIKFVHGGDGGSDELLQLNSGEYIASVELHSGKKDGHTRIFYIKIITNQGRSVSGGSKTGSAAAFTAEPGWQIVGFHGLSGDGLDKCGVIYAPFKQILLIN